MVRYEGLLRDPSRELRRICESFGFAASAERLEEIGRAHAFSSVPSHEKGADKEIRSAEPGGWRRHMTAAEQRAMYEEMGERLVEVGYLPGFRTARVA
jgi:hypothetical protein